ncbi:2-amino-4-hydroxy-6-hydroxymethyldihydropteridine diphosphokinase [Aliifodinibius sp. S!AR15-10]|uniref:2-amino-4-hydroxy-6- hydroxymethyldihydropteridine diphosphokinase n=1 Tax=Aliifodinibius sp. S!AR15-10 TaxID=2950437 RepID=UPI002866B14B|nr:2-amino-4-hydroxy-6-hydroxymethyldihydropteridine diphosphokinase [Aliifodinibius sp. S!AR15-10]MDR8392870.1 2-amino-4-hydroxy-6-hydroxymethyldihydropteridine diphosphokinase [Aliifodinibius sp. S!AR15-10]
MATAIIGVGSNVGDRLRHLSKAKSFLAELSKSTITFSSIYICEPVGPSERNFFNAVITLQTDLAPSPFIRRLKEYEAEHGRPADHPRWSPRTIDLDIIAYDDLVIQKDNLIIPHPEYRRRLFVLLPLRELNPGWVDPETRQPVDDLVRQAPSLIIHKTKLSW